MPQTDSLTALNIIDREMDNAALLPQGALPGPDKIIFINDSNDWDTASR